MANEGVQNELVFGLFQKIKTRKIEWIANKCFSNPIKAKELLQTYWNSDEQLQNLHDEFIENAISNFYLPQQLRPTSSSMGRAMFFQWLQKKARWLLPRPMLLNFGLLVGVSCRNSGHRKNRSSSFFIYRISSKPGELFQYCQTHAAKGNRSHYQKHASTRGRYP